MKQAVTTFLLVAVLAVVPVVRAETITTTIENCTTDQYGGSTCGKTTTTEVVSKHEVVETGVEDWEMWQVMAALLVPAVVATYLYKKSYSWYILG